MAIFNVALTFEEATDNNTPGYYKAEVPTYNMPQCNNLCCMQPQTPMMTRSPPSSQYPQLQQQQQSENYT